MRVIDGGVDAKVTTRIGTEPLIIVWVDWPSGAVYYSEKAYKTASPWLKSVGDISVSGTYNELNSVSTVQIQLIDPEESLEDLYQQDEIEGIDCTVYLTYPNITNYNQMEPLLKGRIKGDSSFDTGTSLLTFSVENIFSDQKIGYAPEDGDITDMSPDAVGVAWPVSFGSVLKIPAIRVKKAVVGQAGETVSANQTSFIIENGSSFPQNSSIDIKIGQIGFTGTFNGNVFTPSADNIVLHSNLGLDTNLGTDGQIAYLDEYKHIVGLYCYVDHPTYGDMFNKCVAQSGKKCWFSKPWRENGTSNERVLGATDILKEVSGWPRESWSDSYQLEGFYEDSVMVHYRANAGGWWIPAGVEVSTVETFDDLYVFNCLTTIDSVAEVYGWRTFNDKRLFSPIPSSYYTKNLSNTLNSVACATLEFHTRLEDYPGENWDGDIFVSVRGSLAGDTGDIVKWIIDNYTGLASDSGSFAGVSTSLTNFPSHFHINKVWNALDLAQEIAWQARCSLYVKNGTVFMDYLSEIVAGVGTITLADVLQGSLTYGRRPSRDIVTRIEANWLKDHSGRPSATQQYVYENNIDSFGMQEETYDFFIYNIFELVEASVDFWGYRKSQAWMHVTFVTPLFNLKYEYLDVLTINMLDISSVRGVLMEQTISDFLSETPITNRVEIAMASDSAVSEDTQYWGAPYVALPDDPTDNMAEIDYDPIKKPGTITWRGRTDDDEDDISCYFRVRTKTEIERSTNFNVRIDAYDERRKVRLSINVDVRLILQSSDGSDALSDTTKTLKNGRWEGNLQVTGGTGDDVAQIEVIQEGGDRGATKCTSGSSEFFDISGTAISPSPGDIGPAYLIPVKVTSKHDNTTYVCSIYEDGTDAAATQTGVGVKVNQIAAGQTIPNDTILSAHRQKWAGVWWLTIDVTRLY